MWRTFCSLFGPAIRLKTEGIHFKMAAVLEGKKRANTCVLKEKNNQEIITRF